MSSHHQIYPPFDLTVQRRDGALTVLVSGELDLATVPRLAAAVADDGDAQMLVLDLTAVTFIDSTGVRMLIEAHRSRSHVRVLAGDGPVRRVLELCGLDGWLALVDDDQVARARRAAMSDGAGL